MEYACIDRRELSEIKGVARLYQHEHGAKVMHIENQDRNKVFSVAFKTPATDNTGVAHIVEHCVLCGSEKYPVKDPFNELMKGSLYTYLNAMTFRDKTLYPIASCNAKDFMNLMDVYLDAVFFPLIHERKAVFLQEGWHYDMGEEGRIKGYGGIVYNEMKGVYSDPVELAKSRAYELLFKGVPYAFDAGGKPENIPDLSYERFLEYYEKHYKLSNCYIYLYGDMEFEKHLNVFSEKFAGVLKKKIKITDNNMSEHCDVERCYERTVCLEKPLYDEAVYPCVNKGGKKYVCISFLVNLEPDCLADAAMALTRMYLFYMEASPLKRALLDRTDAQSVTCSYDNTINQPVFSVVLRNTSVSGEVCKEIMDTVLQDIITKGLDEKLMTACFNRREFLVREENFGTRPKGLIYNITASTDWLNGRDPFIKLSPLAALATLRKDKGFLLQVMQKNLLENKRFAVVALLPEKPGRGSETSESYDGVDREKARAERDALAAFQKQVDPQKHLDAIPLLSMSDVKMEMEYPVVREMTVGGMPVVHCNLETNGILYADFIMDTSGVPQELLPYIGLLCHLMGKLNTKKHSIEDLARVLSSCLGGYQNIFKMRYIKNEDNAEARPALIIKTKALAANAEQLFELVAELGESTLFNDERRILQLMEELASKFEMGFINEGQNFALQRAASYIFKEKRYEQQVAGLDFYRFLKENIAVYSRQKGYIKENLQMAADLVFKRENMVISFVCDEGSLSQAVKSVEKIKWAFREKGASKKSSVERLACYHAKALYPEGFITPSTVQHVVKVMDFQKGLPAFTGQMAVLSSVLNGDYLLKKIRQEGGAYGAFSGINRHGLFYFVSYRDPHLSGTMEAFEKALDFLESFDVNQREMNKYIMGTLNKKSNPKHVHIKGQTAIDRYCNGIRNSQMQREMEEIAGTTVEDIQNLGLLLKKNNDPRTFCVFGNERKIMEHKGMFCYTGYL